ncbi:MAG: DUF6922 domain-containing protein [Candidatus Rokuibacteriota bacterium]
MNVPPHLHDLFWDCRPESLDIQTHAPLILERVLEYGSLSAARWALQVYGPVRLGAFLHRRGLRTLSRKTLSLWTVLLGIEGEPCFATASLRRSRPFWNY